MSWYAVDAIDDALNATRAFLFPFSLGRWARLALVTLFLGGGGAGVQNVFQYADSLGQFAGPGAPGPVGGPSALAPLAGGATTPDPVLLAQAGGGVPNALPFALGLVGLVVIAVFVLLALLFTVLGPVFEFVFVDVIATDDVRVRSAFRRNFWKGMRLLAFSIGLGILFAVPIVLAGAVLFGVGATGFTGMEFADFGVGGAVALLVLLLGWMLLFSLVYGFTRQFVVPVMFVDDVGVLSGWSTVWGLLRAEVGQSVLYVALHFLVGIGVALVRALLALVALVPVGIVAVAVGFGFGAVAGGAVSPDIGVGVGVIAGGAVGLLLYFLLVFLPLNVLTRTYLRTYELAALAGFDGSYDVLARYRDGGAGTGPGGDDRGDGDDDRGDGFDGSEGTDRDADDGFGEFVPAEDLVDEDDRRRGAVGAAVVAPA
ncbi:DUF7544 domain-containing protein [Halorarum salinum]|uniref:Uncharacterized protein n=1 Tax=Halorarum salinum TaxID=2743089 RepID=A0A7D5LBV3_9EURY|nr:hypothetical protein [Halobaculum salinum]QLG63032.1 hypothetical protein HUG12_15350 [Halobaculum salinum]